MVWGEGDGGGVGGGGGERGGVGPQQGDRHQWLVCNDLLGGRIRGLKWKMLCNHRFGSTLLTVTSWARVNCVASISLSTHII